MSSIEKKELIDILDRALSNDELAVFVGAGLSIDAGYCDWKGLLQESAKKLKLDINKEEYDLISLAQFYCNEYNRSGINELVSNSFTTNIKPTENHIILSELPISTYWTTNYDTLIEDALKTSNKRVSIRKMDTDLQLPYSNYDSIVYKMHGDIQSISEAVITRDDYEGYGVNSRKLFRNVLEGALLTKTFLFLGFSFNDPNFNFVLSKLRVLLGDNNRTHYYILRKHIEPNKADYHYDEDKYEKAIKEFNYNKIKQELQIKDLERYGIKILLIDDYNEITEVLRTLLNRYKRRTIFISGSAEEYSSLGIEVAKEFISLLSLRLIENGYRVVNGYGLGIGTYVINGVAKYCYDSRDTKIEDKLKLMPFPLNSTQNESLIETWKKYREEMISQCGIAIYMFGNKQKDGDNVDAEGIEDEFNIATRNGLINIPLSFTGYMAKNLYEKNEDNIKSELQEEELKFIIEKPTNIENTVDGIIKIINRLNNK